MISTVIFDSASLLLYTVMPPTVAAQLTLESLMILRNPLAGLLG